MKMCQCLCFNLKKHERTFASEEIFMVDGSTRKWRKRHTVVTNQPVAEIHAVFNIEIPLTDKYELGIVGKVLEIIETSLSNELNI